MKKMILNRSIKIAAIAFSTALFACLAPMAQGQVENLVFTETAPTGLTETLNGNPIGNWSVLTVGFPGPASLGWIDTAPGGIGQVFSANNAYAALDFADPLNPGNYLDVWGPDNIFKVFSDAPASFEQFGQYPGVGAGDFLPFSASDAYVTTLSGPIPVNITILGSSVPDGSYTVGLLLFACAALVIAKKHWSKVVAC